MMDFNTWKEFYAWDWVTKEQVEQAVKDGILTPEQYKEITNLQIAEVQPVETKEQEQLPVKENAFIRMIKKIYD